MKNSVGNVEVVCPSNNIISEYLVPEGNTSLNEWGGGGGNRKTLTKQISTAWVMKDEGRGVR